MPVTGQWLDEPPPTNPNLPRNIVAGVIIGLLLLLAGRVLLGMLVAPVAPTPAKPQEAAATATVIPPATAAPILAAPPTPEPTLVPLTPAPAAPTAGDACPDALAPPAGARVGWLARAAGCPDIALANLDGVRQWVRRDALSDDIYGQLPEIEP